MASIATPNPAYIPGSVGPGNLPTIAPTPVPTTPDTINSQNTAPQTPINYTTPAPVTPYPVASLDPTVPTLPATLTPSETDAQNLTKSLETLNLSLEGKSADQATAEGTVGLPALQATQNDLSARLKGLQNEASAIPLQLQQDAEGKGITASSLATMQTGRLRTNAIAALGVSTLLAASQGQITNAQALADKMVAQKYDPITEQINAATANLKLIISSPEYSLEEKNRAQAQLDIQNAKAKAVAKAAENDTAIQNIAITAAKNGADAVTLKNITTSKDPVSALIAAGKYNATPTVAKTATATEQAAAEQQTFSNAFVPGATYKASNGETKSILDPNGFLTPDSFKSAVSSASNRTTFLKNFGYLLYAPNGTVDPSYGLTPVESKLVTGALPGA